MSLGTLIHPDRPDAACTLVKRWKIHPTLAQRLVDMANMVPFPVSVISGFRSVQQQRNLRRMGRPAADPARSTHTVCPALGADVWPHTAATSEVQATLGLAAVQAGLRWGGGSPPDPRTLIPSDWNHVDLGPRPTT